MKGFPNQISNIGKLTSALGVLSDIIRSGGEHGDDAFGEQLLRHRVINPGAGSGSLDDYLASSRQKPLSNQSHRTSARGLREFLRLAHLVETELGILRVTPSGNRLLEVSSNDDRESLNDEWKGIARNISAVDSEARVSHPYQIMLKMLTVRPGTPRSLCALALEALDDSDTELDRIITLRDLNDESQIRASLGISKSNWDNAKKILPSIAEQIGDVARGRDGLYLVTTELTAPTSVRHTGGEIRNSARKVTVDTIATTKTPDDSDEAATINQANLVSLSEAIAKRTERSHRHNRLVQQFSASLLDQSAELWEGTFDCLAIVEEVILLAEMKTLDGSDSDETDQVRAAAAQLLYYEAFDVRMVPELADRLLIKIAAFESTPSDPHVLWLESIGVWVVWRLDGGEFAASENSRAALADHLRLQSG